MKLYFTPGACSFAPHIALREIDVDVTLEKVDLRTKTTASGEHYTDINPLGYVPALRLDNGTILTEAVAILLYIADQKPDTHLIPEDKTPARYELYKWLAFTSSELHKGFGPLFNPALTAEERAIIVGKLNTRFAYIEAYLAGKEYFVNNTFSIADIYAFVCLGWTGYMQIDMTAYPNIQSFLTRIGERNAVKTAYGAEQI